MAIPVYLQQFKAAGVYRVVFDKSTVAGVDSEILRLVVGYSEKGPFNIPTYVKSVTDFKAIYGDISKKLEKRGIFFHRTAIQALSAGPILCLNLKKFDGETVNGATINSDFNPKYNAIETVSLNVEDIYDTTRFWELSAEKLNNLKSVSGVIMDQYINICTTNTKETSGTYFIRKASGKKVSGYNITVNDWYASGSEEMPDFLAPFKNSLISDFFAEIYVFGGRFISSQVLASSTLKNYFEVVAAQDSKGNYVPAKDPDTEEVIIKLRPYLTNAYGEAIDTLDELYSDETSNAIAHYIGCLIPNFKNKQGQYVSLDILFNSDQDTHNMMMSFNVDALEEEGIASIDLSGRLSIPAKAVGVDTTALNLDNLFAGTAQTRLLGNDAANVVVDKIEYLNSVVKYDVDGNIVPVYEFNGNSDKKVTGTLYVSEVNLPTNDEDINLMADDESGSTQPEYSITLKQIGVDGEETNISFAKGTQAWAAAVKLGAAYVVDSEEESDYHDVENDIYYAQQESGAGTYYEGVPFIANEDDKSVFSPEGPTQIITSITRLEKTANTNAQFQLLAENDSFVYKDEDNNLRANIESVATSTLSHYPSEGGATEYDSVYGSSVSFLPVNGNWKPTIIDGVFALVCDTPSDSSLFSTLQKGDCLLANDGSTDANYDGYIDEDDVDGFFDNVYVQESYSESDNYGNITKYVVKFSGEPKIYSASESDEYIIRINSALNQEIGDMRPKYLKGYTYKNDKPAGTGMMAKLNWQKFILSTLTEYKGIRTALLNKADLDYRYIVDTFETFIDSECKNVLSLLAKEKQSAFAILNFPSVKTFIKCPYTSFTNAKGVFDVDYVVKGYNKKKAAGVRFSLPTDVDGASFCAFYTPLKFSDGYVDTIVPSAGLVSNLFINKYASRQPYYIIAGPNYGLINASGLVGPDYSYSQDELQLIEPFGVNCMIYRPGFGTFINANQTAKQTPVSALSKVNVRELVIYIQDEIEKVLQAYQWEFNNQTTRNAILDKANMICARVAANGGIQAYLNVMDESNNTPEIIDNEMAVLSTHIEPGMGCGKMVQELTLYRTGQMAATILD